MKTKVVLDLTVSGEISHQFELLNGDSLCYEDKETSHIYESVWRPFKSTTPKNFKINAFHVVSFKKITLPIVELVCDAKFTKTSDKDLTVVELSTGKTLVVDQDISYIENAINSL